MIVLVKPPRAQGVVSGGFLYDDEIGRRLQRDDAGRYATFDLDQKQRQAIGLFPRDVVVFDSLFITAPDPDAVMECFSGARRVLLLHYLPSSNPRLNEDERAALRERETAFLERVDGVITPSRHVARLVKRILGERSPQRVHVVPPGLSKVFLESGPVAEEHEEAILLTVAPITADKGQLRVAKALEALPPGDFPVRYVLVGSTEDKDEVAALQAVSRPGLSIEMTGVLTQDEVAGWLRRADLYVSASAYESYGMATAEAAAQGLPIVSSRVGEAESFVAESRNGRLFDALDDDGLRLALAEVLQSKALLRQLRTSPTPLGIARSWEDTWAAFRAACQIESELAVRSGMVSLFSACELPTEFGGFTVQIYRSADGEESLLIHKGNLQADEPLFVRVHSECFTGEVLHSLKCDCRPQLLRALTTIAERQRGAVIYLRQEGRGIGLGNKILAYAEQDKGADTIQANEALGFPVDLREFTMACQILELNGVRSVELNTNNPDKIAALKKAGIEVQQVIPSTTSLNPHNEGYLQTKYEKLGHLGLRELLTEPPGRPA